MLDLTQPDLAQRRDGLLDAHHQRPGRRQGRSQQRHQPAERRIYAHADGTNSVIDFSKLPELFRTPYYDSGFEAGNGGSILAGSLTTLNRGDIQLDDSKSSITTSQITTITSSNLYVYAGGDLAFPALISSYSNPNGATAQANGAGSVLDLTHLTSLTGVAGYSILYFNAQAGGEVNLAGLSSDPAARPAFTADAASSLIQLSSLTTLSSDPYYNSTLTRDQQRADHADQRHDRLDAGRRQRGESGTVTGGTCSSFRAAASRATSTIQANVISAGTTIPGSNGTGVLTIGGNFTPVSALARSTSSSAAQQPARQYDQLAVTGAVELQWRRSRSL